MHLKKLELSNFRCFESLSIDLDEQLIVLVAENGVGKTAILDAIAVALGPFIGGFDTGVSKGFKHQDARIGVKSGKHVRIKFSDGQHFPELNAGRGIMESKYPVSLVASGMVDGQLEHWFRELTGEKTQTTFGKARVLIDYAKKLQQLVRADEMVTLPIVAYYGTGRLWKQTQTSNRLSAQSHSRLFGYHDALNPDSTYKEFEKWFRDKSLAERINKAVSLEKIIANKQAYNPLDESSTYSIELAHVRKAIDQCLSISGWKTLEYDLEWRELVFCHQHGSQEFDSYIPAAQLSDGVKAMLSLTADIAYRCVQLNPHLTSPTEETTGIVLIDEVDLHLHPKWQQTVLADLRETFKKIQFIVTTHSPQVISTVPSQQIRIILDGGKVISAGDATQGAEASRILNEVFGTQSRAQHLEIVQKLNRYLALIDDDKWDTEDALVLRQTLDEWAHGQEPELIKADIDIRMKEYQRQL